MKLKIGDVKRNWKVNILISELCNFSSLHCGTLTEIQIWGSFHLRFLRRSLSPCSESIHSHLKVQKGLVSEFVLLLLLVRRSVSTLFFHFPLCLVGWIRKRVEINNKKKESKTNESMELSCPGHFVTSSKRSLSMLRFMDVWGNQNMNQQEEERKKLKKSGRKNFNYFFASFHYLKCVPTRPQYPF